MGEVLHSIQSQHPRPKCIVLAPLKGFVRWLREVHGHELLLTLGFDRSLASLMSKALTAAESAQELDLNLSFVDSDGDLVNFFSAVEDGLSQLRMRIGSGTSRRVIRLRSAGEDSLVVLLEDGSPLQVVAPRSSVEDGSLARIQEAAEGLGMLPISMKKPLCTLCESYLAGRKDGQCPDEDASFHFKQGAMLSSLHWWGDESVQALRSSFGLLAGYLYEPDMLKQNAEAYAKGFELIAELLRLVQAAEFGFVSPAPLFVDLGSGDGRVVIAVSRRLGIRGVGVEMDAQLVRQSVDQVPDSLRGLRKVEGVGLRVWGRGFVGSLRLRAKPTLFSVS
ncbi:Mlycd [Symbiodinium sp. CCMP2592]|nr:Mlycd [Symbiodinium sp. CCMP2592]